MILHKKCFLAVVFCSISILSFGQNQVYTYTGFGGAGFKNGTLDSAKFNNPFGMCIDKNNNLYIADALNNCVRKINTTTGIVSTLAGNGVAGWKDGKADSAEFNSPSDVCVDDSGNVYVSDFNNQRIRKITIAGMVITIAGSGTEGYLDGKSDTAQFDYPRGICMDAGRNIYIADSWNHRIRKISPAGMVTTYAGGGTSRGVQSTGSLKDANDTSARFYTPSGLTIDGQGNIYVADAYNHRIREISTTQAVTTLAGNGATGPGNGGFENGSKSVALLNTPTEVFVDNKTGELYIGDTYNNRIRMVNIASGNVSTVAGNGAQGFNNAIDTLATFYYPRGVVVDSSGANAYVSDFSNNAIRLIILQQANGINDKFPPENVIIFPNPSEGIFTIFGSTANVLQVDVFDVLGKEVEEIKSESNKTLMINLSCFPKGIYVFNAKTDSGNSIIKKVVME